MRIKCRTVCLVGPSGVGKTSYARRLVNTRGFALPSVVTTRQRRSDDDGRYRYVTDPIFAKMVDSGQFLEWDKYSHYRYGTLRESVEEIINSGRFSGIILDLTPTGCQKVLEVIPKAIVIALLPDDPKWLFERLMSRGSQPRQEINARTRLLESYLAEMNRLVCKKVYARFASSSWDNTFREIETAIFGS